MREVLVYMAELGGAVWFGEGVREREVMELHREGWEGAGWEVRELGEGDVDKEWVKVVDGSEYLRRGTKNPWAYERSCWLRWGAYWGVVKGEERVMMSDWDMVNRGRGVEGWEGGNGVMGMGGGTECPCLSWVDGKGMGVVKKFLGDYVENEWGGRWSRSSGVSDQHAFLDFGKAMGIVKMGKIEYREVGDDGWEEAKLVHVSHKHRGAGGLGWSMREVMGWRDPRGERR